MLLKIPTAVRALALSALIAPCVDAHPLLLSPNGGEILKAGSTYVIQWTVGIQHTTVFWHLSYSTQGAGGPWLPIARNIPPGNITGGSMHSYTWTVPATASNQVRVRIEQDNSPYRIYRDYSDMDLTIEVPGSYRPVGMGCTGTNGVPSIMPVAGGVPRVGMVFSVDVANLWPNSPLAVMMTGLLFPTPLNLAVIGAPNCVAYVDSYVYTTLQAQTGTAVWMVSIPNSSVLIGSQFSNQVITLDSSANALGLVVSGAAQGVIGN